MQNTTKGAINYLLGRELEEGHPKYKLQQMFNLFKKTLPSGVQVETPDFYNNGYNASLHFKDDEFIIVCDMKNLTMESSILVDYDLPEFEVFEVTDFDWDELRRRAEIYNNNLKIQVLLNSRSKAIEHIKKLLGKN